MDKKQKITVYTIRILSLASILIFMALYFVYGRDLDVQDLLNYSTGNLFLTAVIFVVLYAIKSLSVFFPIILLEVAVGMTYTVGPAIVINIIGNLACFTVPYLLGRYSGQGMTDYLIKKHPKLHEIYSRQKDNEWFISFFLRAISCLPGDIVSIYLGAQKFSYPVYLFGSLSGSIFGIIAATVMGDNILDPSSPQFIIAATVTLLIALSATAVHLWNKKIRRVD